MQKVRNRSNRWTLDCNQIVWKYAFEVMQDKICLWGEVQHLIFPIQVDFKYRSMNFYMAEMDWAIYFKSGGNGWDSVVLYNQHTLYRKLSHKSYLGFNKNMFAMQLLLIHIFILCTLMWSIFKPNRSVFFSFHFAVCIICSCIEMKIDSILRYKNVYHLDKAM